MMLIWKPCFSKIFCTCEQTNSLKKRLAGRKYFVAMILSDSEYGLYPFPFAVSMVLLTIPFLYLSLETLLAVSTMFQTVWIFTVFER